MKTKKLFIAIILICVAFTACKKNVDKPFAPEEYYFAGKSDDLGFAVTLHPGGEASLYDVIAGGFNMDWKYNDNNLIVSGQQGSIDVKIKDNAISEGMYSGFFEGLNDGKGIISLQKNPSKDAFAGKTFQTNLGSTKITMVFDNNMQYKMTQQGSSGSTEGKYTLFTNGVGKAIQTGSQTPVLLVMIDGKLVL